MACGLAMAAVALRGSCPPQGLLPRGRGACGPAPFLPFPPELLAGLGHSSQSPERKAATCVSHGSRTQCVRYSRQHG